MPSQPKRPPSPYSSSQSPRNVSEKKAKVWRSLSGTGKQHTANQQIEKSREMWLQSLRLGTDTRNSPVKGVHGITATGTSANLALTSSSEYLREQFGITTNAHQHKRSSSFSGTSQPRTPRYKSQEEMYDEILQLKKTITAQKTEFDLTKSKIRRLEEEISRKDKCVDQLIEQISILSEGTKGKKGLSADNKLVVNTLRQQKNKLEHNLKEKDDELQTARERIKNLRSRARQAKTSYVQEVMQLQEALKQYGETSSMNLHEPDEIPNSSQKVKTLRQSVVKLTGENNRLQDENRSLKRDLERALDGSEHSDDENEEKIKYSALSRSELVAVIKKTKNKESSKSQEQKQLQHEEHQRVKKVIQNLKADINQLRNEKNHQTLEIERLLDDNEKLKEDKIDLLRHAEKQQQQQQAKRNESARSPMTRSNSTYSTTTTRKQARIRQQTAARSIQKHWRKHKQDKENDDAINLIQSSFRGHSARQEMLLENKTFGRQKLSLSKSLSQSTLGVTEEESSDIEEEISSYDADFTENKDINIIQAAMRGHTARSNHLKHSSRMQTSGSTIDFENEVF